MKRVYQHRLAARKACAFATGSTAGRRFSGFGEPTCRGPQAPSRFQIRPCRSPRAYIYDVHRNNQGLAVQRGADAAPKQRLKWLASLGRAEHATTFPQSVPNCILRLPPGPLLLLLLHNVIQEPHTDLATVDVRRKTRGGVSICLGAVTIKSLQSLLDEVREELVSASSPGCPLQ